MKKVLTIIAIIILGACSMSPAPTEQQLIEMGVLAPDTIKEEITSEVTIGEEVITVEIPTEKLKDIAEREALEPDTTKRLNRKEEIKKINEEYEERKENVMKQIDKIEQQQQILDSLLKKKKEGGDNN